MLTKKWITMIAGLLVVFGLAACSGNEELQEENSDTGQEQELPEEGNSSEAESEASETEELEVSGEPQDPAAIVNGEEITIEELNQSFAQVKSTYEQQGMEISGENKTQIQQSVLDQLINRKLISQAAEEQGFSPSEDEIQGKIDELKEQFGDEESFNEILEQNNLTIAGLEKEIENELKINKFVEENVEEPSVTKQEIEERYEQYKEQSQDMPKLSEVEEQIEQEILNQKNQSKIQELVNELKEDSEIEVLV